MSTTKVTDALIDGVAASKLTGALPAVSGASLTALNATELTSGTLPDARLPATLPAKSGVNLTSLNASNLGSGTVPTARLGSGTASSSTFLRGDSTYAAAGGGKVLQCLTVQTASVFTTTSTSFVDVTSMSLSITPASSSNKILVLVMAKLGADGAGWSTYSQLVRGSTVIGSGTGTTNPDCLGSAQGDGSGERKCFPSDASWLDSPSSSSSTTYKLQLRVSGGTGTIGRSGSVHVFGGDYATSLTLIEIGA